MIITRSPLRLSLGGGGTDLKSYYEKRGGFLIAGALDKYVYMTMNKIFKKEMIIKYSEYEIVQAAKDIKHPIYREAMLHEGYTDEHVELTSMADIHAGTGLGSSSSFTTALLLALKTYKSSSCTPTELAELASKIEIDILGAPIGKQDQYIAAYGGLRAFTFNTDGSVEVETLNITEDTLQKLQENLKIYFTGVSRSANTILEEQDKKSKSSDEDMFANLDSVKEIGYESKKAFESGDLYKFGELLDVHWQNKKKRSSKMSNPEIDEWYEEALKNGALGGKLIGAGGGGFLMFYAIDKEKLEKKMEQIGLEELKFNFDNQGATVVNNGR